VRDTLRGPVFDAPGDHEAKGDGLEHYRAVLGELTYSFKLGRRWQILGLNSMGVDDAQLAWARQGLKAAKENQRAGIVFIHHNFAGIKDKTAQDKLNALVKEFGVVVMLAASAGAPSDDGLAFEKFPHKGREANSKNLQTKKDLRRRFVVVRRLFRLVANRVDRSSEASSPGGRPATSGRLSDGAQPAILRS
jgi:hypothetical protein